LSLGCVRDDGSGFPPQFLAQAFERFSRAKGSRTTPGVGLGLAIVAAITHAYVGTATALSNRDGGADVTLRLPRSA
jgi:two-component system, OmpR family, sensor kinase